MGTDASPRSRVVVIACGAVVLLGLLVGAALIVRDGDSGSPDGSTAAIVLEPVATESIVVTNDSTATIARHGDDILIVDGIATSGELDPWEPGAEPSTRVWVVDGDNPSPAQPYDLPMVGPRLYPEVWWWDGQWALLGERCPEPWDQADVAASEAETGEAYEPEYCGSFTADLFLVDPESGSVRAVVTDLVGADPQSGPGRLRPLSTNADQTVLKWSAGSDLLTVSLDGTLTDIDNLSGRRAHILPAGDTFVALEVSSRGDSGGEVHDVADLWRLFRLDGTEWVAEPLPDAGVPRRTSDGGTIGNGFVLAGGILAARNVDPQPPPEENYVLFAADPETGETGWELIPIPNATDPLIHRVDSDAIRQWQNTAWIEKFRDPEGVSVTKDDPDVIDFERIDHEAWWGPMGVTVDDD